MILITLIACFGFAALYSAAGGGLSPWAAPQMVRFGVGLIMLLAIACVDLRVWMGIAYPAYAVALLLLVAVEVAGRVGMGAQRWLELGPLALQPSEPMKITLCWRSSRFLHGLGPDDVSRPLRLFAPLLMILAPAVLVLMQPNLGTATLLVVGGAMLLFLAGLSWRWIASTAVAVAVAIPSAWLFLLHDYQKQRVLTFLNPDTDALGAGWNTAQAKIALGSGGLFGKGFLMGTQSRLNFLPEKQTDFIIAIIGEEFGFLGMMLLLGHVRGGDLERRADFACRPQPFRTAAGDGRHAELLPLHHDQRPDGDGPHSRGRHSDAAGLLRRHGDDDGDDRLRPPDVRACPPPGHRSQPFQRHDLTAEARLRQAFRPYAPLSGSPRTCP